MRLKKAKRTAGSMEATKLAETKIEGFDISDLLVRVAALEAKVAKLEMSVAVDGIYVDGSPDYVRDFVAEEKDKK